MSWRPTPSRQRRASKHLLLMPANKFDLWGQGRIAGWADKLAVIVENPIGRRRRTNDLARNHDVKTSIPGFYTQCTSVQCLVMKDAQGQPIAHVLRPSMGMPLNVRGFQSQEFISQPHVEVANRATSLIFSQDTRTKRRISHSPWCLFRRLCLLLNSPDLGNANRRTNLRMKRRREVPVQKSASRFQGQLGAFAQSIIG